jgi:hypothetical protein
MRALTACALKQKQENLWHAVLQFLVTRFHSLLLLSDPAQSPLQNLSKILSSIKVPGKEAKAGTS